MRSDMEQTRKWMWAARNLNENLAHGSHIQASLYAYESWEEKAFAEDSAAHLGGCVWPPRSYPCSFCKREFRSAQALGGHMNVHRRDRARLKQSLNPVDDDRADSADDHPQIHSSPSSKPCASLAPPDLSPRVSVASTRQYALFSPPCRSSVSVLLELVPADQPLVSQGLKLGSENSSPSNRNMDHDDDEVEDDGEEGEENIGIKRRRTTEINFSTRISSGAIREKVQSDQVLKQSPWPVEELDLELRLGQKRKLAVMVGL